MKMRGSILVGVLALSAVSVDAATTQSGHRQAKSQPISVPQIKADEKWMLRLPKTDKVAYHGIPNFDGAGSKQGPMLYPAPNAAGFLAGVLTHALISESIREKEKANIQKTADRTLATYADVLSEYTNRELFESSLAAMVAHKPAALLGAAEKLESNWLADALPIFYMSQSSDSIWVETTLNIYNPRQPKAPPYTMIVKVLSRETIAPENRSEFWNVEGGRNLKAVSRKLFAESLALAFEQLGEEHSAEAPVYETVRYMEGGIERMERGQILRKECERIILKNLRGWTMSVPRKYSNSVADGGTSAVSESIDKSSESSADKSCTRSADALANGADKLDSASPNSSEKPASADPQPAP